ncbi:nucleoside-diphosphate-sugar epimerase [Dysgonomonas sp. PFB1-18]|uniref:NAD-dependent epimerase/dehydratase family protein n=1 Tax=unclassified Dysgonomonas TaxID=2630389 RepID=UPI002474A7A5|nr:MULTISPECIES: NAD(P)-dependent oxidoreductase [unclassified Dysgonomonas]MDH6309854.1 nucleoside-diphosphate-sugar epimerase [Dysgonomonas sp. PF1-14]MDH6339398.1 nucleoside-diphosphate-sugar epimerase [Dysgonomonas sp. PF1-16]MDH6380897.1 nucleoside-diphosphate-sugar epimerase [Dysgonomonas sp. PFB1-18]MDH6397906.1 nucleoside-diphosphate-sugar epimerase [Dysgonomonas sp. PF1-23]
MNNKRILITGASGFIGSSLIEKALKKGYDTWAGIRKSSSREYLQDERIRFIDLDFGDKAKLEEQLREFVSEHGKFDYIVHNAGVTKCLNAEDFDRVNFGYTANFIDALQAVNAVPEKFILMSSLSAIGVGDEVNYAPLKLNDTPNPNTAYGKSKLKAEQYLQATNDFPYIILRPTGVYGPREKDYFLMVKTVKSGLDVGAGFKPQHLTFIYVRDLVDAVYLGLESDVRDKAYFVADGDVYTDKEYTRLVKEVIGKKHVLSLKVPLWLLKGISVIAEEVSKLTKKPSTLNRDKYKIMKQRNWECDITPLVNDLGFSPKYNLRRGLEESVQWYKENNWL